MENNTYYDKLIEKVSDIVLSSSILIIIAGIIGIIGNAIVIFVYLFRIKERGERFFIPLLAVVDLLGCLVSPAYFTLSLLSSNACRILYFLQIFITGISGHTLLLISIQRYILVCRPFGPRMTHFWKRVSFGVACFVSLSYSIPLLATAGLYEENFNVMNQSVIVLACRYAIHQTPSATFYFYLLFGSVLVNILLTVGFYIPVLSRIKVSLRFGAKKSEIPKENYSSSNGESIQTSVIDIENPVPEQRSQSSHNEEQNKIESHSAKKIAVELHDKKETTGTFDRTKYESKCLKKREVASSQRRITIMFFGIIVTYVLSYIPPLVILNLSNNLEGSSLLTMTRLEFGLRVYMGQLVILNHIVNPLIYGFFDKTFRKKLCHPCR